MLESIGAELSYENQRMARIMAKMDGRPPPSVTKLDQVCKIRFSASSPPTAKEMKLLASFPNLTEVDFPGKLNLEDLHYFSECTSLRVVSFTGSDKEVLTKLAEILSTRRK